MKKKKAMIIMGNWMMGKLTMSATQPRIGNKKYWVGNPGLQNDGNKNTMQLCACVRVLESEPMESRENGVNKEAREGGVRYKGKIKR